MVSHQVPLQHGETLAVLQTDDPILPDRLLHRHRRRRPFCLSWLLADVQKRPVHLLDQSRQCIRLDSVMPDMGRHNLRGQAEDLVS